MAGRARKHESAFFILLMALGAAAYAIHSIGQQDWVAVTWSASMAIAVPCWLIAIKAPTRCGVMTEKGHPCPNRTYGILFGCGSAEGHTWDKFFARFGWRREPRMQALRRRHEDGGRGHQAEPVVERPQVLLGEDRKSRIAFWLGFTATVAGCISAGTDIAGLFSK